MPSSSARTASALTCSAEGDFASIAPEAALCLYRIAQEALRNVVAHAGASRADVRLLRIGDHAEITITDDGKGFDVTRSLERGKGLGLVSIRSGSGSPEAPSASRRTGSRERVCGSGSRSARSAKADGRLRRRRPAARGQSLEADAAKHRPARRRPRDRQGRPGATRSRTTTSTSSAR